MKTRILLILFIAISFTTYSQDSLFQLKDYKYRTPGFRALELGLNLVGSYSDQSQSPGSSASQNFSFDIPSLYYAKFISTDKRWFQTNIENGFSYQTKSNRQGHIRQKDLHLRTNFNWDIQSRNYAKDNKYFELTNSLQQDYYFNHFLDTSIYKYNYFSLVEKATIGLGKGRIEWVRDAQMAMFIINDLQQQGLLTNSVSYNDYNDFAKLITYVNNKRIFDYRRRRIFELTEIEKFLKERNLVNETDIRHFTTINDNWTGAINPDRRSGGSWFARLQAKGIFEKSKTRSTNNYITHLLSTQSIWGGGPEIGYENFKPKDLNWQRDFGIILGGLHQTNNQEHRDIINDFTTKESISTLSGNLFAFYALGYYPNTRTSIRASIEFITNYTHFNNHSFLKNSMSLQPELNFTTGYFLGYRTNLYANIFLNYTKNYHTYHTFPSKNGHTLNGGFSIGLNHAIF